MANIRQPRPNSGLVFQADDLQTSQLWKRKWNDPEPYTAVGFRINPEP
jgi:hypothetical protein